MSIRSFFKKWLELERRIGDEDGQRVVKGKAIEWTQRTVVVPTQTASI